MYLEIVSFFTTAEYSNEWMDLSMWANSSQIKLSYAEIIKKYSWGGKKLRIKPWSMPTVKDHKDTREGLGSEVNGKPAESCAVKGWRAQYFWQNCVECYCKFHKGRNEKNPLIWQHTELWGSPHDWLCCSGVGMLKPATQG